MDGSNRVHGQDESFGSSLARSCMLVKLRKEFPGQAIREAVDRVQEKRLERKSGKP